MNTLVMTISPVTQRDKDEAVKKYMTTYKLHFNLISLSMLHFLDFLFVHLSICSFRLGM